MILDGAYPECALGLQYKLDIPFMYINTVGFHTAGSISRAGSPVLYSITPTFVSSYTDDMNFFQRLMNSMMHASLKVLHSVSRSILFQLLLQILLSMYLLIIFPLKLWLQRERLEIVT